MATRFCVLIAGIALVWGWLYADGVCSKKPTASFEIGFCLGLGWR